MTAPDTDTITVLVPFSKQEVQVPRETWKICQRLENRLAIVAVAVLVGLFGVGIVVDGAIQVAGLGFLLVGWFYFDGLVARQCAVRKVRRG